MKERVKALEQIMTSADEGRICNLPARILTRYVNLCDKYTLTIEEAAAYFGIGQKKIRSLVQTHENDDFILHVGVKVLIKRKNSRILLTGVQKFDMGNSVDSPFRILIWTDVPSISIISFNALRTCNIS